MAQLIQINSAAQSAPLHPRLSDASDLACSRAFFGYDLQTEGIDEKDPDKLAFGHTLIKEAVKEIRSLCGEYRYAKQPKGEKDHWQVLCTSGANGTFRRDQKACFNCKFFDTQHHPAFSPSARLRELERAMAVSA